MVAAIIKKRYVALLVVKKLPVLLMGKISTKNKNIKGVIKWLYLKAEFEKYFLKKEIYNMIKKIEYKIIKPNNPVSVSISK